MDPRSNPYAPGAGTPPPELAGRGEWIEGAAIALDRIRAGRASRSFVFHGLRGVGKTVLLNRIRLDAEARGGFACVPIEAPEDRSLPAALVPALRAAILRLRPAHTRVWDGVLGVLAGFLKAMHMKYKDVEIQIDVEPRPGIADSGDLTADLSSLTAAVGRAAKERGIAVVFFVDELQYVEEDQLAALITALHHAGQDGLPVTMIAAGLPQLVGQTGRAKSYAERLFEFVKIDSLEESAARDALVLPAEHLGVGFDDGAVTEILKQTRCYPFFLQVWGKYAWDCAERSPIGRADVRRATAAALADLDDSFFRVRFERLTPAEKRYLRAMAELGPGPHRSGDIAAEMGVKVESVAPRRSALIEKGMIYSPAHGDTAFTVPLFDRFMKRLMPTSSS